MKQVIKEEDLKKLFNSVSSGKVTMSRFRKIIDELCFFAYEENIQAEAEKTWDEACNETLKMISNTFLDEKNLNKAERESDKSIFLAIGETIQKFPKPKYKKK